MRTNLKLLGTVWLLVAVAAAACGDNLGTPDGRARDGHLAGDARRDGAPADSSADATSGIAPTVVSRLPAAGAIGGPRNTTVSATFSEPMDRATLTAATFTLVSAPGAVAVPGTVVSTSTTVSFVPTAQLAASTTFTATVEVGAQSAGHVALATADTWSFTTGTQAGAAGVPVALGHAGDFVLLGKSGITNVPTSMVTGDIAVSPITSTAITGFPLTLDASNQFATTPEVTGHVLAADYATPTPGKLTVAITDMQLAFAAAAARAPDVTELGAGTLGSVTLAPGVYKWSGALLIPTSITLSGTATDVWIFQIGTTLTISPGANIVLAGGALPKNVFWQAGGDVLVHAGSHLDGNVLTATAATLDTGASLHGRLLAQTLVTLRAAVVTAP